MRSVWRSSASLSGVFFVFQGKTRWRGCFAGVSLALPHVSPHKIFTSCSLFLPIAAPTAQSSLASHLCVPVAYRLFTAVVYWCPHTAVSEPCVSEMKKIGAAFGVACPKCWQPLSSDQDWAALISLIHPARHLYLPRLINKNRRRQGKQTF